MSEPIKVMKRVGTVGNYLRITDSNRALLRNGKMCEVLVEEKDGRLVEIGGTPTRDLVGNQKIAPIISEILQMDIRRAILIGEVAKRNGGEKALEDAGLAVPEQTIHTASNRQKDNNDKQAAKVHAKTKEMKEARAVKREESRPAKPQTAPKSDTPFEEDI